MYNVSISLLVQTSMNARSCMECAETGPAEIRLAIFNVIAILDIAAAI